MCTRDQKDDLKRTMCFAFPLNSCETSKRHKHTAQKSAFKLPNENKTTKICEFRLFLVKII